MSAKSGKKRTQIESDNPGANATALKSKKPKITSPKKSDTKANHSKASSSKGDPESPLTNDTESMEEEETGGSGPSTQKTSKYSRGAIKPFLGGYLRHIGAITVGKLIERFECNQLDIRTSDAEDLPKLSEHLFDKTAIRKIAFFVEQEYPCDEYSHNDIVADLRPLITVSQKRIHTMAIQKKYKDELPKAPRSALEMYAAQKVEKYKEKHSDADVWKLRKNYVEKWKNLEEGEKKKYESKFQAIKEKHEEDMKAFFKDHPDAIPKPIEKKTPEKRLSKKEKLLQAMTFEERRQYELNEQAPKQPVSSYLRFCKEKREKIKKKHSDFGFVELNAQLSAKWTALGPIGQAPYKKAYEDEYQQYKKDLLSYYDTHSDLVPPPKVEKLLKKIRMDLDIAKSLEKKIVSTSTSTSSGNTSSSDNDDGSEEEGEEEEEEEEGDAGTRESSGSSTDSSEEV